MTTRPGAPPTLSEMFTVFGRIGLLSFGGPAAQIALMHRELVDGRGWLSDRQYTDALGFCMLLPGPEAMQLATYCGWHLRGVRGGLLAGLLFVLPGALVIAALALAYAAWGNLPQASALLLGIKCAVIAILVQALIRLAGKALEDNAARAVAVVAFVAIFALNVPFPLIIVAAALLGIWRAPVLSEAPEPWPRVPGLAATVTGWSAIWLAPLAVLWLSGPRLLFDLGAFFAKLAVVTFGGAYAVLAYMSQEVVTGRNWLTAPQMLDALGLAETTPGPLILVTQFVGMVTGYAAGGAGLALAAGALVLWVTFVPCFLWIFAGAPFIGALSSRARPRAALRMISAAVVGVIVNLAVWFTIHTLFEEVGVAGPLPVPRWDSLVPHALLLVPAAFFLTFARRASHLVTVPVMACLGIVLAAIWPI